MSAVSHGLYPAGIRAGRDGASDLSWQSTGSIQQHPWLSWAFRTCQNCFAEGGSLSCHWFGWNLPTAVWGHGAAFSWEPEPLCQEFSVRMGKDVRGDFGWCSLWSVPSKSSSFLLSSTGELPTEGKFSKADGRVFLAGLSVPRRERALSQGMAFCTPQSAFLRGWIINEGLFKSESTLRMELHGGDAGEGCAIRANSKTKHLKIHPLQWECRESTQYSTLPSILPTAMQSDQIKLSPYNCHQVNHM